MKQQIYVYLLGGLLITAFSITGCEPAEHDDAALTVEPEHDNAVAVLHPTEGSEVSGVVSFRREADGIRVTAEITGLPANSTHGFHIHEYGDCTAGDAISAGGHFNPHGMAHGGPDDDTRHVGDLGNIETDTEGVAVVDFLDDQLSFSGAENILGRGVIVHEGEDDLETSPTGEAGAREACGVIGVAE